MPHLLPPRYHPTVRASTQENRATDADQQEEDRWNEQQVQAFTDMIEGRRDAMEPAEDDALEFRPDDRDRDRDRDRGSYRGDRHQRYDDRPRFQTRYDDRRGSRRDSRYDEPVFRRGRSPSPRGGGGGGDRHPMGEPDFDARDRAAYSPGRRNHEGSGSPGGSPGRGDFGQVRLDPFGRDVDRAAIEARQKEAAAPGPRRNKRNRSRHP